MHLTKLTATLAAVMISTAAAAEPVAVEYLAEQKAFKVVKATDVLDFHLYEDESCSVEIGTYPLFGGDEHANFFVDKHQRVSGGERRAKAVRIRAVIDAPVMGHAPYLRVTGPGITPVGNACQLQAGSPVAGSGPSGPAGPMGPQGELGVSGVDGATGPQGPAGAVGATGPEGPQGFAGADGATGPEGPQGFAGADGATGPEGLQGPAGADGATGPEGPQGFAGADGATGPEGPQGFAGADGATGPEGPQGFAGADGATGPEGPQGFAGADGATGPEGPQGFAGADGATGPEGLQGPAGADGATGPQGPQGFAGADGATGPQGPQGDPGTAGMAVEAEASAYTNSGTVSTPLAGGSTDPERFCFLTSVDVLEIDSLLENGACSVTFDGATGWRLDATVGGGNAEATCKARCLSW